MSFNSFNNFGQTIASLVFTKRKNSLTLESGKCYIIHVASNRGQLCVFTPTSLYLFQDVHCINIILHHFICTNVTYDYQILRFMTVVFVVFSFVLNMPRLQNEH